MRYLKVPAELSTDAGTFIVPNRYQDLIIDAATVRGWKSRQEWDSMSATRAEYERGVAHMKDTLLTQSYGNPDLISSGVQDY